MDNMMIYEAVRQVPDNAKKAISAGRLKGMTDINPMWRIKTLTEQFGPCGIGWTVRITDKRVIDGADGVQVAVVDAELRVKLGGEWSEPICGTGGSSFTSKEKTGLYTSDEAFKMAYTDAISVCCKLLGFGADVYWQNDRTKYEREPEIVCECCGRAITGVRLKGKDYTPAVIASKSMAQYGKKLCWGCSKDAAQKEAQAEAMAQADFTESTDLPPWEV